MINVELHVIGGKHSGQVINLSHKKFLIGREQDCHLRPNSELVSRHHCILTVDDFSVRLRDLGSTNGTLVNGERLRKEVVLQPDDLVLVGNLEFKVIVNDGALPEATPAAPASSEETGIIGSETIAEMPPISASEAFKEPAAEQPAPAPVEQAEEPAAPVAVETPAAAAPPVEMPQAQSGDTTIIQPMMMPGQPAYQPMMPQQMGYPMYQGYPYQGVPGQMPMYPQQMPGQPMPGYPQQQMPMAPAPVQQPAPEPAQPAQESATDANVSLPDPAQTGAKEPEAKPAEKPAAEGDGGGAGNEEPSNLSAAAIIQKHMQRRPGG